MTKPDKWFESFDAIHLAEWMHDQYEEIAAEENWNTQEATKTNFHDLPIENKNTMTRLAHRLMSGAPTCSCVGIAPQSQECYDQMILLQVPEGLKIPYNLPEEKYKTAVSVDPCLAEEIASLWEDGIRTMGCCCGHNTPHRKWQKKLIPNICVLDADIPKMIELGYRNAVQWKDREDIFYPKTVGDFYKI